MTLPAGGPPSEEPSPRKPKSSRPHGFPALNPASVGPVTRAMVRDRASQLGAVRGCPAHEASKSDWDEARRQLSPEHVPGTLQGSTADRNEYVLGSALREVDESRDDEVADAALDDRERSDQEMLVMEGMAAAERDLQDRAQEELDGEPSDDRKP